MEIRRDFYLDKLIKRKNNGLIKVITGIRRCGKSYLLNTFSIIIYWRAALLLTISYVLPSTQRTTCTGLAKALLGLKKKSVGQTRKNSWLMSELK